MNNIKEKYTCDACRYTFESDKLPDRCPDCGKLQVRRASESEIYMNMNIVLTRRKSKKSAVQRPLILNYYFIVAICQFPLNRKSLLSTVKVPLIDFSICLSLNPTCKQYSVPL